MRRREVERAERRRVATAYHEAGHVVAGVLFGQRFAHVSIVPDYDTLGRLSAVIRYPTVSGFAPWGLLVSLLAGPVAEGLHRQGRAPLVGASSDYGTAADLACEFHPGLTRPSAIRLVHRQRPHARRLLVETWHAVDAVAAALLSTDTVCFACADRIVWQSLPEAFSMAPHVVAPPEFAPRVALPTG